MPDLPDYNNNEPKGEWPGGSTEQKCGKVSCFLYLLSCVNKRQAWQSWRWWNVAQW